MVWVLYTEGHEIIPIRRFELLRVLEIIEIQAGITEIGKDLEWSTEKCGMLDCGINLNQNL